MLMLNTFLKLPESKQEAIYNAAAQVFSSHGYHRANIADICKLAGISNGALYKYVQNKSELYIAVMRRCGELFEDNISGIDHKSGSFYQSLEELAKRVFSFAEEYTHYWSLYHDLGSPSMAEFASVLTSDVEEVAFRLQLDLVENGKRPGEIKANLDIHEAASLLDNTLTFMSFTVVL